MTEAAVAKPATGTSDRAADLALYEKTRKEFKELIARKRALEKRLVRISSSFLSPFTPPRLFVSLCVSRLVCKRTDVSTGPA
jgi:hypothetical protein